jgi:hypothetical protein
MSTSSRVLNKPQLHFLLEPSVLQHHTLSFKHPNFLALYQHIKLSLRSTLADARLYTEGKTVLTTLAFRSENPLHPKPRSDRVEIGWATTGMTQTVTHLALDVISVDFHDKKVAALCLQLRAGDRVVSVPVAVSEEGVARLGHIQFPQAQRQS